VSNPLSGFPIISFSSNSIRQPLSFKSKKLSDIIYKEGINKDKSIYSSVNKGRRGNMVSIG
jgi:hypothetical protein